MGKIEDQIYKEIKAFADFLPLITDIEPTVFEKQFHEKLNYINEMSLTVPEKRSDLMRYLFDICAEELDKSSMQAQSRNKPFGYPGDYMIIDWIYTKKTDLEGVGKLWDEFYHRQAAPQAVRNRKDYFCNTFANLLMQNVGDFSVLNIASGPCRDVKEALEKIDSYTGNIHIHCVDMDPNAIAHAKGIMDGATPKANIQLEAANAFRIKPSRKYDLVWSAGLFDYLDDRYAVVLLKKMWRWTNDGGKIIIGNFHPRNPTRNHMEWGGDWFLIYRTEEDLLKLCIQAGIPVKHISFDQEPLGVNIFCIITKS